MNMPMRTSINNCIYIYIYIEIRKIYLKKLKNMFFLSSILRCAQVCALATCIAHVDNLGGVRATLMVLRILDGARREACRKARRVEPVLKPVLKPGVKPVAMAYSHEDNIWRFTTRYGVLQRYI